MIQSARMEILTREVSSAKRKLQLGQAQIIEKYPVQREKTIRMASGKFCSQIVGNAVRMRSIEVGTRPNDRRLGI